MSPHNLWHLNAPFPVGSPTWAALLLGVGLESVMSCPSLFSFSAFCLQFEVGVLSSQLPDLAIKPAACCPCHCGP